MLKRYCNSIVSKFMLISMLVLSFVMIQATMFSSAAKAAVPYTYTMGKVDGKNVITVTFDSGITVNSIDATKVSTNTSIKATDDVKLMKPLKIDAVEKKDNKTVQITVGDLDPDIVNYQIDIKPGVIKFDTYKQLTTFVILFSSGEFGDSFEDTFIKQDADDLNDNVFKYNAPRDITIYAPKRYITKIETIHKYQGVGNSNTAPKLTNVDILTTDDVKKMVVDITDSKGVDIIMSSKVLTPRSDLKGFNFGQAGLNIETSTEYKINMKAYDVNGKLIDERSIVPKIGKDKDKDFTINDYITSSSSSSSASKKITLYDLMKDAKTLSTMLEGFSQNLNCIKVAYANTKNYRVIKGDGTASGGSQALNDLADALNDNDVRYIKFEKALTMELPQDITISRANAEDDKDVIIEGNESTIKGNITIGSGEGDTNIYELRNIKIDGDLIIKNSTAGDYNLINVEATNIIVQ